MEESPYSEKVIELFKNPKNVGEISDADGIAKEGSPACGDMVKLFIKVDKDSNGITDIKFKSYGCASNIATGSIITEMAKGRTLDEAKEITWKEAAEELGGLPKIKTHCSVLAVDALKEAIRDYEERHGLAKERGPTDEATVKERLKHVMNPLTGLDVVNSEIVKEIKVQDGQIKIQIDLEENHQFSSVLEEDIREKLEALWDIEKVVVGFSE
ncbi:nitrogen fixation protein NifU [candidate division MSBL1 archaeon SCGC-AAA259E19]|uniref:Nitrogen fixation protein NifU n=1 Tax=candidate division MSBL1 archaeon SCGC-AAA259E19 TaxID=1698264 RepID=A0A133UKG3_9EURY|nr:nitrogen fixation protein NifU [candidate division MSBL1 archaeon SCGC-AAA259E19]